MKNIDKVGRRWLQEKIKSQIQKDKKRFLKINDTDLVTIVILTCYIYYYWQREFENNWKWLYNDTWYRDLNTPTENIVISREITNNVIEDVTEEPVEAEYSGELATEDQEEDPSDDSDSELLAEYIENIEKLKAQNVENVKDEGVRKSIKYFNKKIRKILTGTTQALQKINYSIWSGISISCKKGEKKKNWKKHQCSANSIGSQKISQ